MKFAFPKFCRLRKSWEYQRLWQMGCKIHTPHFVLLVAENTEAHPRLGLTVSRKVGNAVMRNRVKRRLRNYFRQNRNRIIGNLDISIVSKRGSSTLSCSDVASELNRALVSRGYMYA